MVTRSIGESISRLLRQDGQRREPVEIFGSGLCFLRRQPADQHQPILCYAAGREKPGGQQESPAVIVQRVPDMRPETVPGVWRGRPQSRIRLLAG